MSDLIIPGVTSRINSDKIIEGLMKVERIPLDRLEQTNDLNREKKQVWLGLNRKITSFRDASRRLYSFQNPFEDKRALSSDESILTASAERNASVEKRDITVLETAKADKFASSLLDRSTRIDPGRYTFSSGDQKITINYRGGTVRDFAEQISRHSSRLFRASTINADRDNIYFIIESTNTGADNRIAFEDKALDFALDTGIMQRSAGSSRTITLSAENISQWTRTLDPGGYQAAESSLTLKPGTELKINITPSAPPDRSMILEMEVRIKKLDETAADIPAPPPGPSLADPGKAEYSGITILNNPFEVPLPRQEAPEPPEKVTDMSAIFTTAANAVRKAADLTDTENLQKIQIPMAELEGHLSALNLRNRNTHREITISNIRIYNPEERGDYIPANPVTTASDARIEIDGIQVTRDSNTVDDLIPGVTLNLRGAGERSVEINIAPDAERIKNEIIAFVGHYNNLAAEIQILTRTNEEIINEIEYFSDEERSSARERLGMLQGEMALTQLRDRLQRIITNNYPWNDENIFTMLAQLGISTNSASPGTGVTGSRLRGYLEINEERLDSAIEEGGQTLKNLFGFDRDRDLVVDSGLAYETDNLVKAYSDTGGIVSIKIGTIDRSIGRTETEIANYSRRLERVESDLRRKYGMMEGALQDLERASRSLDNMNMNNSR